MKHPVLLRPECVTLVGGDVVVGLLLSQIVYWYQPDAKGKSKLGIYKNGVWWVAKTREGWMEETGLTLKQYKRAISVLKEKGLIEVKIKRFKGLAIGHLRLIADKGTNHVEPKAPTAQTQKHQPLGPKGASLLTDITTEITADRTGVEDNARRRRRPEEDYGKNGDREKKRSREIKREVVPSVNLAHPLEGLVKAKDILKAHTAPPTGSLSAYWKSRCATVLGTYQHQMTAKECGQLKQLSKYLGIDTRPVIDYAINHWGKFGSEAAAIGGVSAWPVEPHVGFLLKYYHVAMNLLYPVAPPLPQMAPVHLIATGVEPDDVHVVSDQELTELLHALKAPQG